MEVSVVRGTGGWVQELGGPAQKDVSTDRRGLMRGREKHRHRWVTHGRHPWKEVRLPVAPAGEQVYGTGSQ